MPIRPQSRRRPNWPGRLVAALVVLALIVVVVVITSRSSGSGRHPAAGTTNPTAAATPVAIKNVSVFHLERNADDAIDVSKTFDGIPGTAWKTDIYLTSHFAGLRPHGFGLAIALDGRHKLRQLRVTSTSEGYSAQAYVADAIPAKPALAPWGPAVDSQQTINGTTTFNLAGRQGSFVLFWITDLGPIHRVSVDELNVS